MPSYAVSALIALCLSYALYIPLPAENALDRVKVQVSEIAMRIFYFYPMNALKSMGVDWQVWWARKSLGSMVRLLRYKLLFQSYDGVKISQANFDGVPVLVYEPSKRTSNGALVLIHGGGFVLLDADSYEQLARFLASEGGITVFNIDYRTAPEHIFPTALDDCERATAYLINVAYDRYGIDPHRVAIMGDSAGGNLAAGSIFRFIDKRARIRPKLQVLLYPLLQFIDFQTPSYLEAGVLYGGSSLADPESITRWASLYFGLSGTEASILMRNAHVRRQSIAAHAPHLFKEMRYADLPFNFTQHEKIYERFAAQLHSTEDHDYTQMHPSRWSEADQSEREGDARALHVQERLSRLLFHPDLSPLARPREDLSKSPKTLLMTCQYDPLRDEGYWYMRRLERAGVDVRWKHYRYAFHAIINLHGELELAERMLMEVVEFLDQNL